ncbi:hypothetical protein J7M28_12730 [bacterium]|nr:hypothetical protein [bacterium]
MARNRKTIRPSRKVLEALKDIPGRDSAIWYTVRRFGAKNRLAAHIPLGACAERRERLFCVSEGKATEIILGCPNCRAVLSTIRQERCRDCGHIIARHPRKSDAKNIFLVSSQIIGAIASLLFLLQKSELLSLACMSLAAASSVLGLIGAEKDKVKLLFRFDPKGEFRPASILKIKQKRYFSKTLAPEIVSELSESIPLHGVAKQPAGRGEWRDRTGDKARIEEGQNLSVAFSLGKPDWQ